MEKPKEILLADRNHSLDCLVGNMAKELSQKSSQTDDGKVVVAIGGYTALGKGTLARRLAECLDDSVVLSVDSFILDRTTKRRLGLTGDEESSVNFGMLTDALLNLLDDKSTSVRPYDHSVGVFQEPIELSPARHIIVEGTASLYPQLHSFRDLCYFIHADDKILHEIVRNAYVSGRGYSEEEFERFWSLYRNNCEAFINPSMGNAAEVIQVTSERKYRSNAIKSCRE